MKRYIDEALVSAKLKEICDDYATLYGKKYGGRAEMFARLTEDIPTADVIEVRHAEWIEDGYEDSPCVCSYCGAEAHYTSTFSETFDYDYDENLQSTGYEETREYIQSPYCPHCGAKMDEKGKNELLENFEQLVKTNDILIRDGKHYEVVIADDNIFVICLMEYDNLEGSIVTHYDAPEIYANQSSINTLEELRFTLLGARMDGDEE